MMKLSKQTLAPVACAAILLGGAISVLAFPLSQGSDRPGSFDGRMGHPPPPGRPESGQMGDRRGPPPHHGPRGGLAAQEDRLRELGVTDEQIGEFKKLEHGAALERVDLRAEIEKAEVVLRYAMQATDVEEAEVIKAVDALNDARGKMFKQDTLFRLKVRSTLGDDVLKQLRPRRPRRPGPQDRSAPEPERETDVE